MSRTARFTDRRRDYLLFAATSDEKRRIAEHVEPLLGTGLAGDAFRLFDAGTGEGTVLTRLARAFHDRFPDQPLVAVGKEVSVEDMTATLAKLPDRLAEHPLSVFCFSNLAYADAVRLRSDERPPEWRTHALDGTTARALERGLDALQGEVARLWQVETEPSGNRRAKRPAVLVLYRADHADRLAGLIPREGAPLPGFDLILAAQAYRARIPAARKAKGVVLPLLPALRPGGSLVGIHSAGSDEGLDLVRRVFPGDDPFGGGRAAILAAVHAELGNTAGDYAFQEDGGVFTHRLHTLSGAPEDIDEGAAEAAWNAAVYVAQVEAERAEAEGIREKGRGEAAAMLTTGGGLSFRDEAYAITRRR